MLFLPLFHSFNFPFFLNLYERRYPDLVSFCSLSLRIPRFSVCRSFSFFAVSSCLSTSVPSGLFVPVHTREKGLMRRSDSLLPCPNLFCNHSRVPQTSISAPKLFPIRRYKSDIYICDSGSEHDSLNITHNLVQFENLKESSSFSQVSCSLIPLGQRWKETRTRQWEALVRLGLSLSDPAALQALAR